MHFIRYDPKYQEAMLALHRSAVEGFVLGMTQQQDEADLMAIEKVYVRTNGEFLLGLLDKRVIAMGGFKRLSNDSAELRRMRVALDLQGRGYGTLLLHELEREGLSIRRPQALPRYRPAASLDVGVLSQTRLSGNRVGLLWSRRNGPICQEAF
jgi:GNAT superfamily N-acetyltransferase